MLGLMAAALSDAVLWISNYYICKCFPVPALTLISVPDLDPALALIGNPDPDSPFGYVVYPEIR